MSKYRNSVQVFDNFFKNPYTVMELGNSLEYHRADRWPGERTENLLQLNNPHVVEFAKFFARKLANDVFYGINTFHLDLRFHKNDIYDHPDANSGWIHNDELEFAGLVYLNFENPSIKTGTSIFDKVSDEIFEVRDFESRKQLNLNRVVTEQYLEDLKNNRDQFIETVNVGNKFNRLVAYDAGQWHRPNNYEVETPPRYSLLFFINGAQFVDLDSIVGVTSNWRDE